MADRDKMYSIYNAAVGAYPYARRGIDRATGKGIPHVARMPGNALVYTAGTYGGTQGRSHIGEAGRAVDPKAGNVTNMTDPNSIQSLYRDTAGSDERPLMLPAPNAKEADMFAHPSDRALLREQYNASLPEGARKLQWGESVPGLNAYMRDRGAKEGLDNSLILSLLPNSRTGTSLFGFKESWKDPYATPFVHDALAPNTTKGWNDQSALVNNYLAGNVVGTTGAIAMDSLTGGLVGKAIKPAVGATKVVYNALRHPINAVKNAASNAGKLKVGVPQIKNAAKGAVDAVVSDVLPSSKVGKVLNGAAATSAAMGSFNDMREIRDITFPANQPYSIPLPGGRFMDIPAGEEDKFFDFRKYPLAKTKKETVHLPMSYHLQNGRHLFGDDWYQAARKYNAIKTFKYLRENSALGTPEADLTPQQRAYRQDLLDYTNMNFRRGKNGKIEYVHRSPGGDIVTRGNNGVWSKVTQPQQPQQPQQQQQQPQPQQPQQQQQQSTVQAAPQYNQKYTANNK